MDWTNVYPSCFICKKPVLGIKGHDYHFVPQYFRGIKDNDQHLTAMSDGHCHLTCLENTDLGAFLQKQMKASYLRVGWTLLLENSFEIVLFNKPYNLVKIIDYRGRVFDIKLTSKTHIDDDVVFVDSISQFSIDSSWSEPVPAILQDLYESVQKDKLYKFTDFIKAFSVEDKLLSYNAVEDCNMELSNEASHDIMQTIDTTYRYNVIVDLSVLHHFPIELEKWIKILQELHSH